MKDPKSKDIQEPKQDRAIKTDRVCYNCGCPILQKDVYICPGCGKTDIDDRRTQIKTLYKGSSIKLSTPFDRLDLEPGSVILLSGDAGSGKTTISLGAAASPSIKKTLIEASEQAQRSIGATWQRIHSDMPFPAINACTTWEHLDEDTENIEEGTLLVVDSVSQLAESYDSPKIVARTIEKVRNRGAIAILIAQFTKDGEMLGPNMLKHLVDVVGNIPKDPTFGTRQLAVTKNRYGGLYTQYFKIGANGVKPETWPYAYSVEGPPGKYRLHLYPLKGATWGGLLEEIAEAGCLLEGFASAANPSKGYRTGYVEPPDVDQRRLFAEDHGLRWMGPEEATEWLMANKKDNQPETPF